MLSSLTTWPAPFDEYLRERDAAADATRKMIEAAQPENLREVILARARAKGLVGDQAADDETGIRR